MFVAKLRLTEAHTRIEEEKDFVTLQSRHSERTVSGQGMQFNAFKLLANSLHTGGGSQDKMQMEKTFSGKESEDKEPSYESSDTSGD